MRHRTHRLDQGYLGPIKNAPPLRAKPGQGWLLGSVGRSRSIRCSRPLCKPLAATPEISLSFCQVDHLPGFLFVLPGFLFVLGALLLFRLAGRKPSGSSVSSHSPAIEKNVQLQGRKNVFIVAFLRLHNAKCLKLRTVNKALSTFLLKRVVS